MTSALSPARATSEYKPPVSIRVKQCTAAKNKKTKTGERFHKCFGFNAKDIYIENSDKRFKDRFPEL